MRLPTVGRRPQTGLPLYFGAGFGLASANGHTVPAQP
ncbi:exported hypothetical protein [Cupriavidus taiwanensis]|nr:exported hypothetical protein [Cupriavidus taiwanensis]SOZ29010.1 exported hypothetical protein [Cupriavidus taiwanensis]